MSPHNSRRLCGDHGNNDLVCRKAEIHRVRCNVQDNASTFDSKSRGRYSVSCCGKPNRLLKRPQDMLKCFVA